MSDKNSFTSHFVELRSRLIKSLAFILIILGIRQSKLDIDNFDKIPLTKPTTKIFFGSIFCLFGSIQLLQLLK